jgi:RNA polymerase sigma-70 factor (ECF subfamily)
MHENLLLERFRQGDPVAFTVIFRLYFNGLQNYASRFTKDRDDANDIISEIFIKLWEKRAGFETMESIRVFLYICARNNSLMYLRSKRRRANINGEAARRVSLEEKGIFDEDEVTVEIITNLSREIQNLSPAEREVITMAFCGITEEEIAEQLNKSVRVIKNHLSSAIRKLVKAYKDGRQKK